MPLSIIPIYSYQSSHLSIFPSPFFVNHFKKKLVYWIFHLRAFFLTMFLITSWLSCQLPGSTRALITFICCVPQSLFASDFFILAVVYFNPEAHKIRLSFSTLSVIDDHGSDTWICFTVVNNYFIFIYLYFDTGLPV